MQGKRKQHNAEMKANIALEAIKGQRVASDIATEYGVHPTQVAQPTPGNLLSLSFSFSSLSVKTSGFEGLPPFVGVFRKPQ